MTSSDEEDNLPLVRGAIEARSNDCHVRDWTGILVSIGCVLSGVICITVISLYKEKVKDEYGIVLDAGSSHTQMFIYKWSVSDIIKGTALVNQIGECTVTDEAGHIRGISSYKNPEDAGKSLDGCIENKAKKLIPSYVQDKSPIYLGATAGMRLLNETDFEATRKILKSVRKTLAGSPFMFRDDYARIISGEEEGISSWITLNYLKKALDLSVGGNENQDSKEGTYGALDMGGASTQITFVPTKPAQKQTEIVLFGKEYEPYTHSFLCYGLTEAQRRFFAQLLKDAKPESPVGNPCAPKGYHKNVTSNYVWATPCVQEHNKPGLTNYTVMGTGNYTLCAQKVRKLFNFTSCHDRKNCSFDAVYLPPTDGVTFLAFSGFYGVIRDLNLTSNVSLQELQNAAKSICEKTWEEMLDIPSANRDLQSTYCFYAQYILTLLSKGYRFNTTQAATLRFVSSINQHSVGWTLGFMINATKLLPLLPPVSVPVDEVQSDVYLIVVIVGALLISTGILVCMLSGSRIYKRRQSNVRGLVL